MGHFSIVNLTKADLPTPPEPKTTSLYSLIIKSLTTVKSNRKKSEI